MESCGWLQGSLVKQENVREILNTYGDVELANDSANIALVVASGSCDVANPGDPNIEFSVARYIDKVDGSFNCNKNPRKLHCKLEASMANSFSIEMLAYQKISLAKDKIPKNIKPDEGIKIGDQELFFYVEWLSGRYKRPAFPSEFDKRINNVWKQDKRKKESLKVSKNVLGIYAKVYPEKEIPSDEQYYVDLLAIIVPDLDQNSKDYNSIDQLLIQYKNVLENAKMEVGQVNILPEAKISLSTFKQYKRFNLDALSYKENHPLPPEYSMSG
ncbi:hypothetical protein [Acinetobacter dispersus]|uniref:hypothetical protein n=1 Tax=Acinetobacter dispersus TaxID=70348 RepID=UPI0021CDDB1C|nr:hypothetical protein [Acinetobacter dispersus]MCU4336102.1 hypothetical protein [Acinetobacter dispersus]